MKENIKNFFKVFLLALYFLAFVGIIIFGVNSLSLTLENKITMDGMLWYCIVNGALYLLGFLLPYLIYKWSMKYKPEINFKKSESKTIIKNIIWCLIAGLTLQLLGMCVSGISTWVIGENTLTNAMSMFKTTLPVWIPAALIAIMPAICEELIYRGVIYDKCKTYFSPFWSACISSIFFGAMHLDLQQLPYAIVLGFALALVYEKTKSILAPMLIHFIIDFSQMTLVLWEVKTMGDDFADADQGMTWQFAIVLSILGILFALWNAKIIKHFKSQKEEKQIEE